MCIFSPLINNIVCFVNLNNPHDVKLFTHLKCAKLSECSYLCRFQTATLK
uniref:Uncharacterized protein n=1 Tax=Anguilla anguilla TaxID=7936 RepID=A0A0E9RAR6_ANGAN